LIHVITANVLRSPADDYAELRFMIDALRYLGIDDLVVHTPKRVGTRSQTLEEQWTGGVRDSNEIGLRVVELSGVQINWVNGHLPRLNHCNPRVLAAVRKQQLQIPNLASGRRLRAGVKEIQQWTTLKLCNSVG
jgi:hypothetical protein